MKYLWLAFLGMALPCAGQTVVAPGVANAYESRVALTLDPQTQARYAHFAVQEGFGAGGSHLKVHVWDESLTTLVNVFNPPGNLQFAPEIAANIITGEVLVTWHDGTNLVGAVLDATGNLLTTLTLFSNADIFFGHGVGDRFPRKGWYVTATDDGFAPNGVQLSIVTAGHTIVNLPAVECATDLVAPEVKFSAATALVAWTDSIGGDSFTKNSPSSACAGLPNASLTAAWRPQFGRSIVAYEDGSFNGDVIVQSMDNFGIPTTPPAIVGTADIALFAVDADNDRVVWREGGDIRCWRKSTGAVTTLQAGVTGAARALANTDASPAWSQDVLSYVDGGQAFASKL